MSLLPSIRVFFAIEPPAIVKDKLVKFISTLKKKSKSNAISFTRRENFHITLQFLPAVASCDVQTMLSQVALAVQDFQKPLWIVLGKCIGFPNPDHPRLIVLDVEPKGVLTHLSEQIAKGIIAANYTVEARPFRPHVTIARLHDEGKDEFKYFENTTIGNLNEPIEINRIYLMQSKTDEGKSRYLKLGHIDI